MEDHASNCLISVTELERQVLACAETLRILDCRFDLTDPLAGHRKYRQGHIPGALFVDLDRDLSSVVTPESGRHPLPIKSEIARRFGALGIGDDTPVVVYDDGGGAFAARAWWLLRWCGHSSVRLLDGGLPAWQGNGGDLQGGDVVGELAEFSERPSDFTVVSTADIERRVCRDRAMTLLDARDEARFRGEVEPIDSVAGHVPGARNMPLTHALNSDGTWKSEAALRSQWRDVPGDRPVAAMCGSGVTACHLILSAVITGRSAPALYAGSWSEWIRSADRPIALGAP